MGLRIQQRLRLGQLIGNHLFTNLGRHRPGEIRLKTQDLTSGTLEALRPEEIAGLGRHQLRRHPDALGTADHRTQNQRIDTQTAGDLDG